MRVLLLFPMQDKQTGYAIRDAFHQLGYKVMAVDAKIEPKESFNAAEEFNPDLVFCSRTHQLTGEVEKIKERFPETKIAMWNVDTRTDIGSWGHLFPLIRLVDYYFVVASGLVDEWRELNPNTFWLPQGLQDEVYDKSREITDEDREKYSCDVSFAGKARGFRRPFLEAIDKMGINFKTWGCRRKPRVFNEEHNKMASLSKINLCCSGWPENGAYTSVRNYKIMGAGGFALEFQRKGLDEVFPLERTGYIGTYVSPNDLIMRIRYFLEHEKEREAFAERGFQWVHSHATYTHRIRKALEIMGL